MRSSNNILFLSLMALFLFGAGCNTGNTDSTETIEVSESMEAEADAMEGGSKEEVETTEQEVISATYVDPSYEEYSASRLEQDQGTIPVVLSFHADWCPICQSTKAAIMDELSEFPNGTNILEVNYDEETDLKAQYGVTTQTTFIVLDSSGNVTQTLVAPSTAQLRAAITNSL